MRLFTTTLLLVVSGLGSLSAAPISLQEVAFLVRQRTPDAEIIQEVSQRRLLKPLDASSITVLRQTGASDALIARLSDPKVVLDQAALQSELARREKLQAKIEQEHRADAAAHEAREQQRTAIANRMLTAGATRELFDGKLVKLEGDTFKPFSTKELADVRIFAIYYSGLWSGPGRQFTPLLVSAYHQIKAKYPEFELIFVSEDHDEFNMRNYMRDYKMPWPAVKFGAADAGIRQFAGEGIPWLVAISDSAQPLTTNAKDKKYVAPENVLQGIAFLLRQIDPNR